MTNALKYIVKAAEKYVCSITTPSMAPTLA